MALVVEDGTGKSDAQSYVSVETFKSWATSRGYVLPAADADIEAMLLKACDFIERKTFSGTPLVATQSLSFPRNIMDEYGGYESTGVPGKLVAAQELLAMESMNGPLTAAARANKYTATKIDQIYLKYADSSEGSGDLYFPAIDDLLAAWCAGGRAKISVVRA